MDEADKEFLIIIGSVILLLTFGVVLGYIVTTPEPQPELYQHCIDKFPDDLCDRYK